MKKNNIQIEKELSVLKDVPPRDPNAAIRGRNLFISEAKRLERAVSQSRAKRHTGWSNSLQINQRKGRFAMISIITSIIVALSLLLGGTGIVQAAQTSLPNDPLYPVKLWSEDLAIDMTTDPQNLVDLYLSFAERRIEELAGLNQSGSIVEDPVIARWLMEIERSLEIAAGLEDSALEPAFLKIRDQLRIQDQIMQQLQSMATEQSEPLLTRTRQLLQERLMLMENGLQDPLQLRDQIRLHVQIQEQVNQPDNAQSGPMYGEGNGNGASENTPPEAGTGGNSYGQESTPGPNPEGGSGYGQGQNSGQLGQCICQPTPTGTLYYGFGTTTPTLCVCETLNGTGSMGTPNPKGNGQGGKP
jgi:hypothetical protein